MTEMQILIGMAEQVSDKKHCRLASRGKKESGTLDGSERLSRASDKLMHLKRRRGKKD